MGRRNTRPKSYLQVFQWLNSFASVDSKKTLPCLGFIEYSPKDQVSLKKHYRINKLEGCCIDRVSRHVKKKCSGIREKTEVHIPMLVVTCWT